MTSYTPGPWYVGAQNDALYVIDRPAAQSNDYPNHSADRECVAKIYAPARGGAEANARLIAHAPQLVEALEAARDTLTAVEEAVDIGYRADGQEVDATIDRIERLLAAIRGTE